MASIRSNRPEINSLLSELPHVLDLDRPSQGYLRGERALNVVSNGIEFRSALQLDPAGNRWPDNAASYLKRPDKVGKKIGVLTGDMLSVSALRGTRKIEAGSATMEYGVTPFQQEKADRFQDGKGKQPPRPFYEISEEIEGKLDQFFDGELDEELRGLGGASA